MAADDWPAVERIYREGIATGSATFEASPPSWEEFDREKVPELRYVGSGRHLDGAVRVFPKNESSLALHHRLGFRDVGVRERVGKMTYGPYAGQWRDVVLIERRSPSIT